MGVAALDLGFRGAAIGLLLMIVVLLLRDRRFCSGMLLNAALAGGAAAYATTTAPFFPKGWTWWSSLLLALSFGTLVMFWLWARAAFDDDFVVRRWHGALWAVYVGLGLLVSHGWTTSPMLARPAGRALSLVALVLAISAAVQTVSTWRADLVAGRRRLRVAVLIGILVFTVVASGSDLASIPSASVGIPGSLAAALGLCALAALGGWSLQQVPAPSPAVVAITVEAPDNAGGVVHFESRGENGRDAIAPLLLRRLDNLMTVERIYRHEGLTIGTLAAKLDLPEYRLRQVINEGLGSRNFNAFLNRYRIEDAKAALSDASQKDVPVLTIAMDAGFQSIGPFNRAFKTDTGLTPTEFRRLALAKAASNPFKSNDNFEIGQSD
jgi:AraC-like DNA-binding protein